MLKEHVIWGMSGRGMRHFEYALSEAPVFASRSSRPIGGVGKRAFDIIGALVCVVGSVPLLIGCCLLVLASGRPVLFRQRRIGFGGQEFTCLKFRTMAIDAERRLQDYLAKDCDAKQEWQKYRKLRNDPRVTVLGRMMRRSSLDELPQLLNVLRGDMSLVGPRPIVADEVAHYQEHFSLYASARPGLTGLWQVSGRNGTTYAQRVAYDVEYVRNWSLMRDTKIVVATLGHVIDGKGAY
jgi:exopolysaccharide production protein ExoY